MSDELEKMVAAKTVNGHPLVIKNLNKDEDGSDACHILFIGDDELKRAPSILQKLGNAPVLTVGEDEGFLSGGGIINLAKEEKRISLHVNLTSANRVRLKISSKLLGVARVQKENSP